MARRKSQGAAVRRRGKEYSNCGKEVDSRCDKEESRYGKKGAGCSKEGGKE